MSWVGSIVVAVGLLTAGCGESERQRALHSVCSARARIAQTVRELARFGDPAAESRQVMGDLITIGANLRQIDDAKSGLDPAQRQQVTAAVESFRSEATAVTGSLLLSERLSTTGAGPKLKAALRRLEVRYQRTLATIDCS